MSKKKKQKKPMNAKRRLIKDLKKLALLIERVDTPLKIFHAQAAVPQPAKRDGRA